MNRFILALLACIAAAAPAAALPSIGEALVNLDTLQSMGSDISCRVKLFQSRAKQGPKDIDCYFYRRDANDNFLIVMIGPEAEKGNGYLRVGDNFWMYRRNTRTFQYISRNEQIGGTDAKGGDFEKRKLADIYRGVGALAETTLGAVPVYKFEIQAKVSDVTYPKQVYWVRRDNFLPLKVQSYSLAGTLMQTEYYLKYQLIGGKYFLTNGLFIDEFEKGNKTVMEISGISLAPINDFVFTKGYLENLSK